MLSSAHRIVSCRMYFESPTYVDRTFSKLAHSLIDGPLGRLCSTSTKPEGGGGGGVRVHTVKVAACDSDVGRGGGGGGLGGDGERRQLLCVYFTSVWNMDHAEEVRGSGRFNDEENDEGASSYVSSLNLSLNLRAWGLTWIFLSRLNDETSAPAGPSLSCWRAR